MSREIKFRIFDYRNKKKEFRKGYEQGVFKVTSNMLDTATWFGAKSKITYNTLYLFATQYRNLGYVSADSFREEILKINHEERITELPEEELNRLVKKQLTWKN